MNLRNANSPPSATALKQEVEAASGTGVAEAVWHHSNTAAAIKTRGVICFFIGF